MNERRHAILSELAWLCDDTPEWAREGGNADGWLPFHVRWFRGGGGNTGERPNHELLRGTTEDVIKRELDWMVKQGLATKVRPRGFGARTVYKITDAGREAVTP